MAREERRPENEDRNLALLRALVHEAGNVIAAIRLSGHFLGTPLPDGERAALARDVELLASQAGALLAGVRPLLDRGGARPDRVDAEAVLDGILALLEGGVAPERLDVAKPRRPLTVQADADALQRALVLLVSYALSADPGGGRVQVRARRSGARVAFTVKDAGPARGDVPGTPSRGYALAAQLAAAMLRGAGGRLRVARRRRGNEVAVLVPVARATRRARARG